MARISIDDPDITDTSIKKHLGFRTSSKTRPYLYKNTLTKAVSLNVTRIFDSSLISELSTLSVVNGRIDHSENGHDDMVIAYLLCCWLVFSGENLQHYGIDVRQIMMSVTSDGTIIDPVHKSRQLELRKAIKHYEELIKQTSSEVLKNTYRQKICLMQNEIDPTITVEPIGVSKVDQDVKDYGSSIYTPQAFARTDNKVVNRERTIHRLLQMI